MTTITGYEGHRSWPVGEWVVDFTPTSRNGDGSVHVDGAFAGTVYVDIRYPDAYNRPDHKVTTFIATDPETYEELSRFDNQHDAIAALVDEWAKHPYAPEHDGRGAVCGDCDKGEGSRFHVGEIDYKYWPQGA